MAATKDWKEPFIKLIKEKIRREDQKAILSILQHPDIEKAHKIHTRTSGSEDGFFQALELCALRYPRLVEVHKQSAYEKSILRDDRKASKTGIKHITSLRELLKPYLLGEQTFFISGGVMHWRDKHGKEFKEHVSDGNISRTLELIEDFLQALNIKDKTRKQNLPLIYLVFFLEKSFYPWDRNQSNRIYKKIGLFVRVAIRNEKPGSWNAKRTRKYIELARRNHRNLYARIYEGSDYDPIDPVLSWLIPA